MKPIVNTRFFIGTMMLILFMATVVQAEPHGLTRLGMTAPDFDLEDVDGNRHRLSDYRGRVVILNFWATWCPPCRAEMPSLQRAWEQLEPEGIVLLGIGTGEGRAAVERFNASNPVDFPLLMDQDSAVTDAWPVRGMPSTFVVDPEGRIAYRAIGAREWDSPKLLDAVRGLKGP